VAPNDSDAVHGQIVSHEHDSKYDPSSVHDIVASFCLLTSTGRADVVRYAHRSAQGDSPSAAALMQLFLPSGS
jgi:hypothetical protein